MTLTQRQRKGKWADTNGRGPHPSMSWTLAFPQRRSHDRDYIILTKELFGTGSPNHPLYRSLETVWLFGLRQGTELIDEELRLRFDDLVKTWTEETMTSSLIHEICTHRAYQRVIGLGPSAIPLILEEVLKGRRHWGWALASITGERPDESATSPKEAAEAWLAWGRDHKLVAD